MRVLHLIPSISLIRGGPSFALPKMVQALRLAGVEAEIATTNDDGPKLLSVPLARRTDYNGVPVWFFHRFSPPIRAIREFAFSRSFCTWLKRHIAAYDLIHVHAIFSFTSTFAMCMARRQGRLYIVRPLGQLCAWSLKQKALKKKIYWKLTEARNVSEAAAIHFTSELERDEAGRLDLARSGFVMSHGIDIPGLRSDARDSVRKLLGVPLNEPLILFLSRLHPKKGLDYLIPALGKLEQRRFTFVLAGSAEGNYGQAVDRMLHSAGLESRTKRLGLVTGDLKELLLQGADLFVLTSHSENFGFAVLEALAAGLPVLVTPGVALATEVQKNHLGHVVALDREKIALAIDEFLAKHDPQRPTDARARAFVTQNYSWDKIARRLAGIYEAILNPSH